MIYDLCGTEINRKSKIINFFLLSKSIKLHKFQNENFFIPTPVSLVQNEGSFKLSKNTAFSASTPEAKTVAEYFAAQMNLATGYQITVSDKAASNGIALAIDEALDVNDEGYTLDVTPQGVTVKAKTPQGLFYGMQS